MRRSLVAGVLLLLLVAPGVVLGWGYDGHRIICDIALHRLSEQARAAVMALTTQDPLDLRAYAESCTWPDRVRRAPEFERFSAWHYINVPRGVPRVPDDFTCPPEGCLFDAIDHHWKIMTDPQQSDAQRSEALKFLSHWVGDIHQPMHVSYADDRGGNEVRVVFFDQRTDLHHLWDNDLLDYGRLGWWRLATRLGRGIGEENERQWLGSTPRDWAQESYAIAIADNTRYLEAAPGTDPELVLGYDYYVANYPIVTERLRQAGVRLAQMLEEAFGPVTE